MRRIKAVTIGAAVSALTFSAAESQVSLDATKITCDQYVHAKVSTPNYIAAWISGYYSARQNKTMIDVRDLDEKVNQLQNYCYVETNFKKPVMSVVEELFGK